MTKLEDADGNDIFAMNDGAGKYGCSELEQVSLIPVDSIRLNCAARQAFMDGCIYQWMHLLMDAARRFVSHKILRVASSIRLKI